MKNLQSSKEGYLFVDHRASPGLPADFARRMGYDPATVAEGQLLEAATKTCQHCGTVVIMNPERVRTRANCPDCGNDYICDFCDAERHKPGYVHNPIRKWIDDTLEDGFRQENDYQRLGNPLLK